jgi:hypothetical protein
MKQNTLRAKLRLKRNLFSVLGYKPGKSVSLVRTETLCGTKNEIITKYDESFALDLHDPRSNKNIGHFFQERNVYKLHDVILEPKNGLVFTTDGKLIEESTNWPIFQMYNSFPWNPKGKIQKLDLDSAIYIASSAFGHWLMEDLPLTLFSMSLDRNLPLLVSSRPPKFVRDFLEIAQREVIYMDGPVRLNSLIMVQKNQDSGWPHPKDLSTLNNFEPFQIVGEEIRPLKKIYASRRGARRSPKNEVEIEKLFLDKGFEVHDLGEFDLKSEIRLMKETLILAGVHGSALVNNIWMPRGGTMVDIVNENYWTEAGHRLAQLNENYYKYLVYKGGYRDEVDLKDVVQLLEGLDE